MKAKTLACTCDACPTQYEGQLEDGRMFYFRYRWGHLTVEISNNPTRDLDDVFSDGTLVYDKQLGADMDGCMSHEEVLRRLNEAGINTEEV